MSESAPKESGLKLYSSEFRTASDTLATLEETGMPEVALVGRSNVGKSTLVNALLQRKALARVGKTPGSTRVVCLYEIVFGSPETKYRGILADLPGYGFAKVSQKKRDVWTRTISRYLAEREQLQLVVLLNDVRRDFGEEERLLMDLGASGGIVLALTKTDKLNRKELDRRLAYFKKESSVPEQAIIGVSAQGKNAEHALQPLRQLILSYLIPQETS